jgi:hypothetical protein
MARLAALAASIVALVASPPGARAEGLPTTGARIALFAAPATFPANAPFYLAHGFTCEDGKDSCLSGLTHFDLYVDGVRQRSAPNMTFASDGTLLSKLDVSDFPSGLSAGTHALRGVWYWLGSFVQERTVTIDFVPARVVVPGGRPLQIAVVLDHTLSLAPAIRNAVQMAVDASPLVAGFRVQLEDVDAPCGSGSDAAAANTAAAQSVVGDEQTVAVVGHACSSAFGALPMGQTGCPSAGSGALSVYESRGIVAINGSATSPCLPGLGPTVFDRTAVADPDFDAWYAAVQTLASDLRWQAAYRLRFGSAPTAFADLYYDATRLLLRRLGQVARLDGGNLVVDRAALAAAVRHTRAFPGVTCTVTIDPATGNRVNDPRQLARCAHARRRLRS